MENRENQDKNQAETSDLSKSQSAQQPNFDRKDETSENREPEFDQSSTDTLAEQRQKSETDTGESLDQRGEDKSSFVGSGKEDSSDEFIDRDKQSDGE